MASILAAVLLLASTVAGEMCPSLPAQVGQPQDLDISRVNLFIDPQQFTTLTTQFHLIENGQVSEFFDSLADVNGPAGGFITSFLPSNLTSLPVQLTTSSSSPLYYTLSLFSQQEEVAPAACPVPQVALLQPNTAQTINIGFSCVAEGIGVQQACLTVGTQPFSTLNGTYHAFTFFFPLLCTSESPTVPVCDPPSFPTLLAEMCVTPNHTLTLVQSGVGSWPVLAAVLRMSQSSTTQGYCVVDRDSNPPGITELLRNDSVSILYPVPPILSDLELYFRRDRRLDGLPLSYLVMPRSENTSVVDHPGTLNGVPLSGITTEERVDFDLDLHCVNPGVTRIFVQFNVTAVYNDIVYSNTYSDLYFYRNCTIPSNETIVLVDSNNLAVELGVSLACCLVFILIVGVAVTSVTLLLYFTRRNRKKVFLLEQEQEVQYLASSNAYHMATFEKALDGLKQLDLEYNYALLEVVGELGEGAFGRVFKAKAPGLHHEEAKGDFFAVKTLKEDADSDALSAFVAEVNTSSQFQHPNVVRLVGVCSEMKQCMIFEYMDLGSLNDVLHMSDPTRPDYDPSASAALLTPDQFLACCVQVAQGLSYLASLKFVHRDIAARNCLVNSSFVVKIADFGMSREVGVDYYRIGSAKSCLPIRWMPPEALMYGKFTVKSDVWSFGVLMWEVYTYALQPFGPISNYEVIDRIKAGHVLECPDLCPASVYDIMKTCWTHTPQRRPTMARVLTRMGHLLRSNSLNALDDYTTMGVAEGYLNLAFGTTVDPQDLEEMRRVELAQKVKEEGEGGSPEVQEEVREGSVDILIEGERVRGDQEVEDKGSGEVEDKGSGEVEGRGDEVEEEGSSEGDEVEGEGKRKVKGEGSSGNKEVEGERSREEEGEGSREVEGVVERPSHQQQESPSEEAAIPAGLEIKDNSVTFKNQMAEEEFEEKVAVRGEDFTNQVGGENSADTTAAVNDDHPPLIQANNSLPAPDPTA